MNVTESLTRFQPLRAPEDEGGGPSPDTSAEADGGAPDDTSKPSVTGAPDFSFLPEQFRKDDKPDIEGFQTYLGDLEAGHARAQERQAEIPEDGSGYEFELPTEMDFTDLDLPKDFAFEFNPKDENFAPVLAGLGNVLHKHGIPKAAAADLMGVLARYEATAYSVGKKQTEAEMAALGSNAEKRVGAVRRSLENKLAEPEAKALSSLMNSADAIRALEKLLAPRSTSLTDVPPPGKRSDLEDYYKNPSR